MICNKFLRNSNFRPPQKACALLVDDGAISQVELVKINLQTEFASIAL